MSERESEKNEIQLILEDAYFPVEEREAMVIKDEKTLRTFFSKVNRTRKPGFPVPEIDFTNNFVIVVCSGEQKGSYTTSLEKTNESKESLTLLVKNKSMKNSLEKGTIFYPLNIYKMPKTEKEIKFSWQPNN